MELKNANPNGCNVVINNLKLIFYFLFPKILKIELNIGLQSLFYSRKFITTHKLKHLIIQFDSLIKMDWFKALYEYINVENQFRIFIYEKSGFFIFAQTTQVEK